MCDESEETKREDATIIDKIVPGEYIRPLKDRQVFLERILKSSRQSAEVTRGKNLARLNNLGIEMPGKSMADLQIESAFKRWTQLALVTSPYKN